MQSFNMCDILRCLAAVEFFLSYLLGRIIISGVFYMWYKPLSQRGKIKTKPKIYGASPRARKGRWPLVTFFWQMQTWHDGFFSITEAEEECISKEDKKKKKKKWKLVNVKIGKVKSKSEQISIYFKYMLYKEFGKNYNFRFIWDN